MVSGRVSARNRPLLPENSQEAVNEKSLDGGGDQGAVNLNNIAVVLSSTPLRQPSTSERSGVQFISTQKAGL
jgi:hypothetical protein